MNRATRKWQPPPPGAIILSDLPATASGKTIWTCSECGDSSTWRKGWRWFGSVLEMDDGWIRRVLCAKCGSGVTAEDGEP